MEFEGLWSGSGWVRANSKQMASNCREPKMLDSESADRVAQSLGMPNELLPHAQELLADLWPLGFSSEPVIRLLERQPFAARRETTMLDLGCGKGALLIQLAGRFGWTGRGIDIMPDFISEARHFASSRGVAERLQFDVSDIALAIRKEKPVDLVIFGYDSDSLGSLEQTLTRLCLLLTPGGHILLETAWSLPQYSCKSLLTESDTRQSIERSRVRIVDTELLDSDWVKAQNARNTSRIRSRAEVLASREPDLKHLVDAYLWVQEEECRLLEEQAQCVALLLSAG
jgi:SAM-dependent methyltransferase